LNQRRKEIEKQSLKIFFRPRHLLSPPDDAAFLFSISTRRRQCRLPQFVDSFKADNDLFPEKKSVSIKAMTILVFLPSKSKSCSINNVSGKKDYTYAAAISVGVFIITIFLALSAMGTSAERPSKRNLYHTSRLGTSVETPPL
jgi:hypothetical protein